MLNKFMNTHETVATVLDDNVHYLVTRLHPDDLNLIVKKVTEAIDQSLKERLYNAN